MSSTSTPLPSEADFGDPLEVRDFVRRHATPGDPQSVLTEIDRYAREQRFLMNVGPVKGRILAEAVGRLEGPSRVLEFGTYCGYSAILTTMHLAPTSSVVTIDNDPVAVSAAVGIIDVAGMGDEISVIEAASHEVIPTLAGPFDLVFMDHDKDHYLRDVQALEQHGLLQRGSVIVADNVGPLFEAGAYLDYVRSSGRYDSTYHPSTVEHTELPDAAEISVFRE